MPFLNLSTNVTIGTKQQSLLLGELSQLLAKETGKPERYVMVKLSGDNAIIFAGNDQPAAYLECKSIGLTSGQTRTLSASICQLLNNHLSLPQDRIYIEFSNCPAEYWGWNGSTFG